MYISLWYTLKANKVVYTQIKGLLPCSTLAGTGGDTKSIPVLGLYLGYDILLCLPFPPACAAVVGLIDRPLGSTDSMTVILLIAVNWNFVAMVFAIQSLYYSLDTTADLNRQS